MPSEQHVARNFLALGGGEAISRLIAFGATVYLGRVLGAQDYGVVALAAGVTLYLAKIADFAIEAVGAQEIARAGIASAHVISAVTAARLALTTALLAVSIGIVQLLLPDPDRTVLSLFFLTLLPMAANTKWVYLGRADARLVGLTRVVGESAALLLVLLLVRGSRQLWLVPLIALVGEALPAVLLHIGLVRAGVRCGLRWDLATALPIFRRASPLVGQLLLGLILYNSELVFLRLLKGGTMVGFYAASYTLISFITSITRAYGMSLLPALTRLGSDSQGERRLYHTALAHSFVACLPLTIGGYFLAPVIIRTTFGAAYEPAGPVLQILIWAIPISIIRNVPWAALIARSEERLLLRATAYSVVANLVLNLILIQLFGMWGAALSTVLTESLVGVLMLSYAAGRGLTFVPLRRLLRPATAGCAMALVLTVVGARSLVLCGAAGAIGYGLALVQLGVVRLRRGALPMLDV